MLGGKVLAPPAFTLMYALGRWEETEESKYARGERVCV